MRRILALAALLAVSIPAEAQEARRYTNASLGRPVARQAPPSAETMAGLASRAFVGLPPPRALDDQWEVFGEAPHPPALALSPPDRWTQAWVPQIWLGRAYRRPYVARGGLPAAIPYSALPGRPLASGRQQYGRAGSARRRP